MEERKTLIEIDTALLSLMGNRNIAKDQKKQGFNLILKSYKENFGLEISTEYIRTLLLSEGMESRKATLKLSDFQRKNDIKPTKEVLTATKPLKWESYGESGFIDMDRQNETTLRFFVADIQGVLI